MEVNDWNGRGKESLTTPGGAFRAPAGGRRTYEFERAAGPRPEEPVRPAPVENGRRPETASPFSRDAAPQPWYAGVASDQAPSARSAADAEAVHSAAVQAAQAAVSGPAVISHDGENGTAYTLEPPVPGGPQVYTITLPPTPRRPAPKQRSLWWLIPALLAALLLWFLLGAVLGPALTGRTGPASEPAASTEPAGRETAASRIYRENLEAVVRVMAIPAAPTDGSPQTASVGTGFLISADGYLLTNAHVVNGAITIQITLSDGRQVSAVLIAENHETDDVALLQIEEKDLRAVRFGDSDKLQVGDWVCTIGNPFGELNNTLTTGCCSGKPRDVVTGGKTLTMLQINAAINKGNSGGPLFNEAGRVVGIVNAKLGASGKEADAEILEGLGFALPINGILDWVREVCPQALG